MLGTKACLTKGDVDLELLLMLLLTGEGAHLRF